MSFYKLQIVELNFYKLIWKVSENKTVVSDADDRKMPF